MLPTLANIKFLNFFDMVKKKTPLWLAKVQFYEIDLEENGVKIKKKKARELKNVMD